MKRILISVLALGSILLVCVPQIVLSQDTLVLEEVIVSARKIDESLQNVPASIAVLSASDLKELNINDITNLQESVAGLFLTESGGLASGPVNISLRGIGAPAGFEPGVAIYLDDVYINSQAGQLLDVVDIQRVEVLKGPQGHLWGRNATGGLIKFVTKKPADEFQGSVELGAGDYDALHAKAAISGPLIADKLNASLTLIKRERDGFQTDVNSGEEYWDEDKIAARIAFNYSPVEQLEIDLAYSYSENQSRGRIPVLFDNVISRADNLLIAQASGHVLPPGLEDFEFSPLDQAPDSAFNDIDKVSTNQKPNDFNVEVNWMNLTLDYTINDRLSIRSATSQFNVEPTFAFELDGSL